MLLLEYAKRLRHNGLARSSPTHPPDLFRFLLAMSRHFQGLSFYSFSFKKKSRKAKRDKESKKTFIHLLKVKSYVIHRKNYRKCRSKNH
jgi:hypothetical protein